MNTANERRRVISAANDPPPTPGRFALSVPVEYVGAAPLRPGRNENEAEVVRSGLDSSAFGYASSVSLTERDGTFDPLTIAPRAPATVISRHPMRFA